jgi:molybdopterin synthase catalytic subunit
MSVGVRLNDGALPAASGEPVPAGSGAVLRFEGLVRPLEPAGAAQGFRELEALEYQTYDPMTERSLHELAVQTRDRHGLHAIAVEHSRGRVPVGACSFRLTVCSAHRAEALAGMGEFIDRMKREIPIWKRPIWRAEISSPAAACRPPRAARSTGSS